MIGSRNRRRGGRASREWGERAGSWRVLRSRFVRLRWRPGLQGSVTGFGRQLGLNAVRVEEYGHGGTRYRVRGRDRGADDCGVRWPRRLRIEVLPARDSERQVVRAGPALVERVLAAVPVLGGPRACVQAVVPEKYLAAFPAGHHALALWAEAGHRLLPGRARVSVTDRQPQVVDARDHVQLTPVLTGASRPQADLAPGVRNPPRRARGLLLRISHLIADAWKHLRRRPTRGQGVLDATRDRFCHFVNTNLILLPSLTSCILT